MGRRLFAAASAFPLLVERPAFHARFGLGAIPGARCGRSFRALFCLCYPAFCCVGAVDCEGRLRLCAC